MQISLDVRNENLSEKRIHQICAWTPARCRDGRTFGRSSLMIGDGAAGTSLRSGSRFPAISTVVALLFSSPRWRQQPKSGVPGHDPRLQKEPKVLKTRQEVDWAAMPSCVPTSKARNGWGMAPVVSRLLFTTRVVADQACNYSPKLSAKRPGGRAQQRKRM
jgi:hypothetical protein